MTSPSHAATAASASLKAAFGGRPLMGCALGGRLPDSLSPAEARLVRRHFEVVTPENCMKPGPIHPDPERYDFGLADAFVRFAESQGLGVIGHCLSWHQQCPDWFYAGLDRRSARSRLERHVKTVAGRYRGQVLGWDVVNEAVADAGDGLRDTPARRAIGDDHVALAFQHAREADPDAQLYYNDYGIEEPGKRDRTLALLEQLRSAGCRVDGVGIQGHWQLDQVPFDAIRQAIAAYRALGLEVMITELDLDVVNRPDCGADVSVHRAYRVDEDVYAAGCPAEVLARQAEQYRELFEIFTSPETGVSRVTFWGLQDGQSWLNYWPGRRTNHPLLFDRACAAKPALAEVLGVAERVRRAAGLQAAGSSQAGVPGES